MFPVLFSKVRNETMLDKFYKYEFKWIYKLMKIQRICYRSFKINYGKIMMISKVHNKSLQVHNLYMTSRKTIQNMFSSSIKTAAHKECHKGF